MTSPREPELRALIHALKEMDARDGCDERSNGLGWQAAKALEAVEAREASVRAKALREAAEACDRAAASAREHYSVAETVGADMAKRRILALSANPPARDNSEGWQIGDPVEKFTGDYTWAGEVRSAFTTPDGKLRYVVAHPVKRGYVLHIYGPQNIRTPLPPPPASGTQDTPAAGSEKG